MTSEHTVSSEADRPSRAAEPFRPQVPEQRRWRFTSALHAAQELNARPA